MLNVGAAIQAFCAAALAGLLGDLHEAEAQFGEGIFQQALLFDAQIALGLLEQDGHQIDGVAGQGKVGLRLLFSFAEVHSPSCISAWARRESTRKVKDAGGSGKFSASLINIILATVSSTRRR